MGLFDRYDCVEGPNRTLWFNDGQVDTVACFDPKTGLSFQRPIAATGDEQQAAEVSALRRALDAVEERLRYVGEPLAWYEGRPDADTVATRRQGLEGERAGILGQLEKLGDLVAEKGRKR